VLIRLKASSLCFFLSCRRFKNHGLSRYLPLQLVGWTEIRNYERQVPSMPQGCGLPDVDKDHCWNKLKGVRVSLIILRNFRWIKIPNYQFHESHTWSPIAAILETMPFPKIKVSMISPNIVNSQHSPSCMKMNHCNNKINKTPKWDPKPHQKTPNYHASVHPAKCQKIPTHNANPWTTVQPVHSILTMTH
jgi:hypothetical protein